MRLSELPIIDRTREEEFEKWWAHANENSSCEKRAAKWVWQCAWCTAKLGQLERAKAEASSEIKAKLFAEATAAFLDGDDAEAMLLRRIANNLGK